jgi:hypothetical protein
MSDTKKGCELCEFANLLQANSSLFCEPALSGFCGALYAFGVEACELGVHESAERHIQVGCRDVLIEYVLNNLSPGESFGLVLQRPVDFIRGLVAGFLAKDPGSGSLAVLPERNGGFEV